MRKRLIATAPAARRRALTLALSALLLAASCGGDSPQGSPGVSGSMASGDATAADDAASGSDDGDSGTVIELGSGDVVLTAGLVRFDDCGTLLDYLHEEYSARVGPWGFDRGGWFGPMPFMEEAMAVEAMADDASAPATTTAASGGGRSCRGSRLLRNERPGGGR